MFKARAVVVVGIVVLPALAVAGLSGTGMPLGKVFSRNAVVGSNLTITSPVIHTIDQSRSATPISAQPGGTDELLASMRMREALVRIVEGAAAQPGDQTSSIKLTFDDQSSLAYVQRTSLGLVAQESELRLTKNATPTDLEGIQADANRADSLAIEDTGVSAGAFYGSDSLSNTLFPSAAARILAAGQGVDQGDQAPAVNRLAGHNAGFAGTDGRSGRRGSDFNPVSFNRPASTEEVAETPIIAQGDDVPAPGTIGMALVALAGLRRRR